MRDIDPIMLPSVGRRVSTLVGFLVAGSLIGAVSTEITGSPPAGIVVAIISFAAGVSALWSP